MYVEPLGSPQVQHNFRVLKNKFGVLIVLWQMDIYLKVTLMSFILNKLYIY
jgi:hypothetical protein